jgi:hypothetical protein
MHASKQQGGSDHGTKKYCAGFHSFSVRPLVFGYRRNEW